MSERITSWIDIGSVEKHDYNLDAQGNSRRYRYYRFHEVTDKNGVRYRVEFSLTKSTKDMFFDSWENGKILPYMEKLIPGYVAKPRHIQKLTAAKPRRSAKKIRPLSPDDFFKVGEDMESYKVEYIDNSLSPSAGRPWQNMPQDVKAKTPVKQIEKWKTRDE